MLPINAKLMEARFCPAISILEAYLNFPSYLGNVRSCRKRTFSAGLCIRIPLPHGENAMAKEPAQCTTQNWGDSSPTEA